MKKTIIEVEVEEVVIEETQIGSNEEVVEAAAWAEDVECVVEVILPPVGSVACPRCLGDFLILQWPRPQRQPWPESVVRECSFRLRACQDFQEWNSSFWVVDPEMDPHFMPEITQATFFTPWALESHRGSAAEDNLEDTQEVNFDFREEAAEWAEVDLCPEVTVWWAAEAEAPVEEVEVEFVEDLYRGPRISIRKMWTKIIEEPSKNLDLRMV
jgi:hypothetical protein